MFIPRRFDRRLPAIVLASLLVLGACGGDDDDGATPAQGEDDRATATDAPATTASEGVGGRGARERPEESFPDVVYDTSTIDPDDLDAGTAYVADECEDRPGVTISHLSDRLVQPTTLAEIDITPSEIGDELVGGVTIPETVVPGAVVDGGCVVEHDAPGGCIGRVEITGLRIPGFEIPGVELPGIDVAGGSVPAARADAVRVEEVSVDGVSAEQVCQLEVEPGERTPSVRRPSIRRESLRRPSARRESVRRDALRTDDDFVPSAFVSSVFVRSHFVNSAFVNSKFLASKPPVADDVTTLGNDEETAYLIEADVLFDVDRAELRPGAESGLRRVADEVARRRPDGPIEVGGHTDSTGDDAYNQSLSEARARTVVDWLVANAGIDPSRITATGYGETAPVASNDEPAGRQQNRRVVISARG